MNQRSSPTATWRRCATLGAALVMTAFVAACDEPEEVEVAPPEMAEVERDDGQIEFERAFPLEAEDIGDTMLLSGTVVGKPGPNGFFVRTEANRVVFVDTPDSVSAGKVVHAVGPLRAIDATAFAGWERDWLGDIDPVWAVVRLYFVDADSVRTM